ncbi:MAG TPA: EAL domain-containing protein [Herbaspirillum sp.]|nr:EAL domain-containing protein [Herbaspirillum sp.]
MNFFINRRSISKSVISSAPEALDTLASSATRSSPHCFPSGQPYDAIATLHAYPRKIFRGRCIFHVRTTMKKIKKNIDIAIGDEKKRSQDSGPLPSPETSENGAATHDKNAEINAGDNRSSRDESADDWEKDIQLREDAVMLREMGISSREKIILDAKTTETMRDGYLEHLRQANERLVIATLQAQAITEELEKARDQMGHMARHDVLTSLPNRVLLMERLQQAISLAKRHRTKLAVLFIDLDRFKAVNDSLGHAVGDQLIQAVSTRLLESVRSTDTVSRQGGDEFVTLLTEVVDEKAVADLAGRMCKSITAPYTLAAQELHIGVTIGISLYPDDGEDAEMLLRNADVAMYDAKNAGGNKYHFFKPEMNRRAVERQRIESDLHRALAHQEFELFYQPQVDLKIGNIVGAEALIRWRHPVHGLLSPGMFMPIAQACGAIVPIGRWVLREACRQMQAWSNAGLCLQVVSVNVSAVEFSEEMFLDHLLLILQDTDLPPARLQLELTEAVLMKNVDATMAILQKLRSMGVKIAIDDFGTGYSSLSYLNQFQIDTLKIDQSFVTGISSNAGNDILVNSIIGLGKNLSCRVIAEGIETDEQLQFLKSHRCPEGQGFYLGVPMNAKDLSIMLENENQS